jgi:hypothetical protein
MMLSRRKKGGAHKTRKVKSKRYEIHDNGGRPFVVDVGTSKLSIYKRDYDAPETEPKHVKDYTFKKVWIGDDTLRFGRKLGWTPAMKGNTILAQLSGGKMLYIGSQIYEFSMMPGDEAVQYSSYIGNSDVPCPWLVGKTHTYLMLISEGKVIPNEFLDAKRDVYDQFYGFDGDHTARDNAKNLNRKMIHKRIM